MKPQHVIALVVVAVLATVVVEETRISRMREEIIRLRAIPRNESSEKPSNDTPAKENMVDSEPSDSFTESSAVSESAAEVEDITAMQATGPQVPDDFPEPDEAEARKLALSPYSDFAYEIGLNNRERAYLEHLLDERTAALQDAAGKWIAARSIDRPAIDDEITLLTARSDDAIKSFLANEAAFRAFRTYHAMQPEREMMSTISPALDGAGATLETDKEKQLIEALHQARVGTGSLDWNSPAALSAIAEGKAVKRFEDEWKQQGEALAALLPKFLSEAQSKAVLEAREALKPDRQASIESAIEAVNPGSE